MAGSKPVKLHNRSDKPDNIVLRTHETEQKCENIQKELPSFMRGFFAYLKGNVLPLTRLNYLSDIRFFCQYLIDETDLTQAAETKKITLREFSEIQAIDVNIFIDYCRKYTKAGEREIKALQDDEVMIMLDAVSTGTDLTEKERQFWEKTKKRDKAILILFLTYGLRLFELQQLNVSSFNFQRGEFKIYRKRDKEAVMPLNVSVTEVVRDYIDNERAKDDDLDEEHKDALFLSLQGRRMTERAIRDLVKKYTSIGMATSRKSGYSPHKLRATAATSLIGRGNSIFDVQALLDHEQVTTTQLYADHKMNVKRDLVKDMEWELERKGEDNK